MENIRILSCSRLFTLFAPTLFAALGLGAVHPAFAQTAVLTQNNDNARSGSNTVYVLSKSGTDDTGLTYLHAYDITTGMGKAVIQVQASAPGTSDGSANGTIYLGSDHGHGRFHANDRTTLYFTNGMVYTAFAHNSDSFPYHGWVLADTFDGGTKLTQAAVFCTTPGGATIAVYGLLPGAAPLPTSSSLVNDTSSAFTYTGSGWGCYPNRGAGDLQDDIHATINNGDSVSYTFTGTGVTYLAKTCYDEGNVQVQLDSTLQATVNAYSAARETRQPLWSKAGLTSGSYALKLVKQDGLSMLLDAAQVSPAFVTAVNDTAADISCSGSGVLFHNIAPGAAKRVQRQRPRCGNTYNHAGQDRRQLHGTGRLQLPIVPLKDFLKYPGRYSDRDFLRLYVTFRVHRRTAAKSLDLSALTPIY